MSSLAKQLANSTADPTVKGLIEVANFRNLIEVGDDAALRRVASVVGGDHKQLGILERHVDTFLSRLRTAMNRVVTHMGFSSTGQLTDALNHPSFVAQTNSFGDGVILELLSTFEDPTGVLAGAQTIISNARDSLIFTYGSKSIESCATENFGNNGVMLKMLSDSTRYNVSTTSKSRTVSSRITQSGGHNTAEATVQSARNHAPSATAAIRTFVTGPRTVIKEVAAGQGTVLHYSSHFSATMAGLEDTDPKFGAARFAIVGLSHEDSGTCQPAAGVVGKRNHNLVLVGAPSDVEIAPLFGIPNFMHAAPVTNAANGLNYYAPFTPAADENSTWFGEQENAAKLLGFTPTQSVLVPLSGIEDMTTGVNRIGGFTADVENIGDDIMQVNFGLGITNIMEVSDDALDTEIDLDMLISILKEKGIQGAKYDIAVFDVAILLEYQPTAASGGAGVYNFTSTSTLETPATQRQMSAIVRSNTVNGDVRALRKTYTESELIERVSAYDQHCLREGRSATGSTLYKAMIADQVRKNLGVLDSTFRAAAPTGGPETLGFTDAGDLDTAEKAAGEIISGHLDAFMKPAQSTTWIGPNQVPPGMVMIAAHSKLNILRRWTRILDYILLESMMDLDFNSSIQ